LWIIKIDFWCKRVLSELEHGLFQIEFRSIGVRGFYLMWNMVCSRLSLSPIGVRGFYLCGTWFCFRFSLDQLV